MSPKEQRREIYDVMQSMLGRMFTKEEKLQVRALVRSYGEAVVAVRREEGQIAEAQVITKNLRTSGDSKNLKDFSGKMWNPSFR